MNNHGNYIVSMGNVCRWMAEQAEEMGVEIFPGMACSELVYGDNGEVKGVVAGEFGLEEDGTRGEHRAGHGAARQVCLPVRRCARHRCRKK